MASQQPSPETLIRSLFGGLQTNQGSQLSFNIPVSESTPNAPSSGEATAEFPNQPPSQGSMFQRPQMTSPFVRPQFNHMGLLQHLLMQSASQNTTTPEPSPEAEEPASASTPQFAIPANTALADNLQINNAPAVQFRRRNFGLGTAIAIFIIFLIIVGAIVYFNDSRNGESDYYFY